MSSHRYTWLLPEANLEPQTKPRGCVLLLYCFVTTPSNRCATNCKPMSHVNRIPNTTCMLIQGLTTVPASRYAYIECCKPTAHLLYQLGVAAAAAAAPS